MYSMVRSALNEKDLHEQQLIVQALHFRKQAAKKLQTFVILFVFEKQHCHSRFDSLAQEISASFFTPGYGVLAHVDLHAKGIWNLRQIVDEPSNNLCCLGFGQINKCWPQVLCELPQVLRSAFAYEKITKRIDCLLAPPCCRVFKICLVEDDLLVCIGSRIWILRFQVLGFLQ